MKISGWIKFRIKSDTDHKLTSGKHMTNRTKKRNCRRGLKIYITPKIRGHTVRIGNKCPRCIHHPKIIWTAFPSLSPEKRSDIRCKPHKLSVDSDSFTISIYNHALTTIYNKPSHFVGAISSVKGEMVKGFVGAIQVKGEGTIVWKIEDDDGI